jgi:cytochrome c peroxidase
MNGNFEEITQRLSVVPEYKRWFEQLFPGGGVSEDAIVTAIATYERTIVTAWAPFDRWVEGDETAISDAAKRGFEVFNTTAACAACHSGWNFTDNQFHDIGLASVDIGRAKYEPDNVLAGQAFKTPGLRNIMYRGPYMHDGSILTIEEVIEHCGSAWKKDPVSGVIGVEQGPLIPMV